MHTVLLRDYVNDVVETDTLDANLRPAALGLFGEVGSIMAAAKKHRRDGRAFAGYQLALEEEFGDALWYFAALCRRLAVSVEEVFSEVEEEGRFEKYVAASDVGSGVVSDIRVPKDVPAVEDALVSLGTAAAELLGMEQGSGCESRLRLFAYRYVQAMQASGIRFASVVERNVAKTQGRFLELRRAELPDFDADFPPDERLPRQFEIRITKRKSGRTYMQWNGVFVGDPLTDNIVVKDGYRFHDVFHLANAAILHWSPVFRGLIKHKRKSRREVDEAQDGGRAVVVEEGVTAWIFARAKELGLFEGHERLSFDLLKGIQQFVAGYEVERCPLRLWEDAILQGYGVFRQVLESGGGVVIGDRDRRRVDYRPILKDSAE